MHVEHIHFASSTFCKAAVLLLQGSGFPVAAGHQSVSPLPTIWLCSVLSSVDCCVNLRAAAQGAPGNLQYQIAEYLGVLTMQIELDGQGSLQITGDSAVITVFEFKSSLAGAPALPRLTL